MVDADLYAINSMIAAELFTEIIKFAQFTCSHTRTYQARLSAKMYRDYYTFSQVLKVYLVFPYFLHRLYIGLV